MGGFCATIEEEKNLSQDFVRNALLKNAGHGDAFRPQCRTARCHGVPMKRFREVAARRVACGRTSCGANSWLPRFGTFCTSTSQKCRTWGRFPATMPQRTLPRNQLKTIPRGCGPTGSLRTHFLWRQDGKNRLHVEIGDIQGFVLSAYVFPW